MERVFLHIPTIRIISVILLVILLTLSEFTVRLEGERQYEIQRNQVLSETSTLRAQLEGYLNTTLQLTQGLVVYISTHPDFTQLDFEAMSDSLLQTSPYIRNIGLAKDNIISHMYPLAGNEAALGLKYLEHPKQRDAVLRAINSGKTVVAGPVNLVQGGTGFISRTPIYSRVPGETGEPPYWGLASVVIKADKLLFAIEKRSSMTGIKFALRGRDGLGARGDVFFGDAGLFDKNPILLDVTLPEGSWQFAAVPEAGWQHYTPRLQAYRLFGILVSLLIAYMVYWLLLQRQQVTELALQDPLTYLPNRRLFSDRLERAVVSSQRGSHNFSLLSIDLDDFKPVNDTYGHKMGDRVLIEVADRLKQCIRESDTLARIGGDEFMLILPESGEAQKARTVADKIIEQLQQPFHLGGHEIKIGVSIGICRYPDDGSDPDILMRHADQALYVSKSHGKGSFNFYDSDWVVVEGEPQNYEKI